MFSVRYLYPRPLLRTRGLDIRGVGVRETMPPCFIERPDGTGDFLLMLFHDTVEWGAERQRLAAGTIIFWSRAAGHFYGDARRRWCHSWVHCDGRLVADLFRNARAPLDRPMPLADPSGVAARFLELHEELSRERARDGVIARNLLDNLVREAMRGHRQRQGAAAPPAAVARVRDWIDTHYEQRTTLVGLAEMAGCTPRHFCTLFRRHYKMPPIAYLIRRRLHAAAALLRGTTEPIGEIARRVGYPDPYYFSKHFRAFYGVSPSHLRTSTNTGWARPTRSREAARA